MDIGRNDRCWCGSGKKYKRCHLGREGQEPLRASFFLKHKRAQLDRKMCLHPEAPGKCTHPARAHTIQREGALRRIARQGKVYAFFPDDVARTLKEGGVRERLVGIGDASVFTGFCAHHDGATFAPIDRPGFEVTRETAFLLAYRALCRDYCIMVSMMDSAEYLREADRGMPPFQQVDFQYTLAVENRAARLGLLDRAFHKLRFDAVLKSRDYGRVRYYALEFDRDPDLAAAATWCPPEDFMGRPLQNLRNHDRRAEQLSYTILARGSGGLAVFAWLDEQKACERTVASLDALADDEIPDALVRLCTRSSNAYLQPEWWEGLPEAARQAYRDRLNTRVDPNGGPLHTLAPDGVHYCDWGSVRRIAVSGA